MEVSGVVYRQPTCFPSVGGGGCRIIETQKTQTLSCSDLSCNTSRSSLYGGGESGVSSIKPIRRGRRRINEWVGGFRDEGHLLYYYDDGGDSKKDGGRVVRCGGNKKDKDMNKKKLKLLKALSKDLSVCSRSGSSSSSSAAAAADADDLGDSKPLQTNLISEAAGVLMKQLEQMIEEEKAMKKKKKEAEEEKAMMMKSAADAKMKCTNLESDTSSSSSESSESSDSDCGEVVDMTKLRNEAISVAVQQPLLGELQQFTQSDTAPALPILTLTEETKTMEINGFHDRSLPSHRQASCGQLSTSCGAGTSLKLNGSISSLVEGEVATRIEVCMGNKCKKMGSEALLEEFGKVVGVEGAVVGCKCMGKCRNGPNVRVVNSVNEEGDSSVMAVANRLCIGVGLEDVGSIALRI